MDIQALIIMIVVGLVAGWLAGQIVKGRGLGLIGDIVVGILGSFIAAWLLPRLGVALPLIGSAIANNNYYRRSYGNNHVDWCLNRYRSYSVRTDTFQPYNGPRRRCNSPYD